jgi:hypothetical protein
MVVATDTKSEVEWEFCKRLEGKGIEIPLD